jgi:hypothetical protein
VSPGAIQGLQEGVDFRHQFFDCAKPPRRNAYLVID